MQSRAHTYYGSLDAEALASLDSMEGLDVPIVVTRPAPGKAKPVHPSVWPGYVAALLIAAAAYLVHYLPFAPFRVAAEFGVRRPVSPAIIAILLGVVARNALRLPHVILEGSKGIVRKVIPVTIVLTGFSLNLTSIEKVGAPALVIILASIVVATGSAYWFGRTIKLWKRTALLIGAGTAICGNSAIVAVAPLIDATDEDLMLSMSTINLLGLPLMFLFPLAGAMLGLGDQAFGVWAGTSIHAVPQVVAAAFAFSPGAGSIATLVKLVRVALLAPFTFVLAIAYARRKRTGGVRVHYSRLVPPFLWGFVAAALMNTLGLIPALEFHPVWQAARGFSVSTADVLASAGSFLLTLAMAAMGLEVDVHFLARVGGRALLTGVVSCLALCAASLALIRLLL
ncbi:MAG TPA: putative sulfate exporter family transporter [Bryobacteraceae bacterium]|nr:putative sulfate exporter family transporter [Bryobacteraceae bacterium]